jgi:hypothetical protein
MKTPIAVDTHETNEALFEQIQNPDTYKTVIMELRRESRLHDFVEWVLRRTIKEVFGEKFSVQPEKYGISNGRIDLALYHTPRSIIHFELIATCRNGHVFRDTSSLLASRADEKLAILIDEDLEADVATNFFKAIPDGQVKSVSLREVLLNRHRAKFVGLVEDLVGSAEFKNGSTDPNRFYCFFEGREIEIFKKLRIEFHNAPVNEILTIQLQQHESMFKPEDLTSIKITEPSGVLDVPVPYVRNSPGESYYLAAYLSSGERWRTRVYIRKAVAVPTVFVAPGEYSPLGEVSFSVRDFPAGAKLRTMILQGNQGQGCNHGQEVTTGDDGSASGVFTVPHFIGMERIEPGKHALQAWTEDSPFRTRAETTVNIMAAEASQQLWRPIAIMTHNHFASAGLRGIGFQKDDIEVEFELLNLSSGPLSLMSTAVIVRNKVGEFLDAFIGGPRIPVLLSPGQPLLSKNRFIRLPASGETTAGPASLLSVTWNFSIGTWPEQLGQPFSLTVSHSLWDPEVAALDGGT